MIRTIAAGLSSTAIPPGVAVLASGRHHFPMQAAHGPLDSVVVRSPLPDPFVPIVQFIFQQPGWALALEGIVGAVAAALILRTMWVRRIWMFGWLRSAPRGAQAMFVGANLATLLVGMGTAGYGYHYMMHDNHFCQGCHIFVPSGQPWVRPDTGNYLLVNALEGKHDTLQCHACHAFEFRAQAREMILWIAARPQAVPPHGRVPQEVCERCHVQGEAKEQWRRIASTAGHSVHLAQDSAAHGGKIQCLTCHARTAHRFLANDSTCAMNGCHVRNEIRLGRMAGQSEMHCTLCHQFTAEATFRPGIDTAARMMIPGQRQCTACHGMQQLTARFDFGRDPHGGQCGTCHDPHAQTRPRDADSTCASCHTKWREIPFHTGAIHRGVVRPTACTACHQPHAARVDASDCTGCHREMRQRRPGGRELRPPLPFDTSAALRTSALSPSPGLVHGKGDAPLEDPPPAPADTFEHARHQRLPCLTCHDPRSQRRLTFEPGRGCQICHHQAPDRNNCARCHSADDLAAPRPLTLTVSVRGAPPRPRSVGFRHPAHSTKRCVDCHVTPVTLAPTDSTRACTACHDQHAGAPNACVTCHAAAAPFAAHAPPVDAHRGCARCHAVTIVAGLRPTRALCLTCHAAQEPHQPERACTACHLQAGADEFRGQLTAGAG